MTVGYRNGPQAESAKPIELFINTSMRSGNAADIAASDAAVAVSLALQYGCPPETLYEAMKRNPDGSPMGVVGRAMTVLIEGIEDGTPSKETPP